MCVWQFGETRRVLEFRKFGFGCFIEMSVWESRAMKRYCNVHGEFLVLESSKGEA